MEGEDPMEEKKHSLRPEDTNGAAGDLGQPLSKRQQTGEAGEGANQSKRPSPRAPSTGGPGTEVAWS